MAGKDVLFSATFADEFGVEASVQQYLEPVDTTTLAQIASAWSAWLLLVDPLTGAVATNGKVTIGVDLPGSGIKTSAVAGSRIEQTAVINFRHAGANKRWGFVVPAINNTKLLAGKLNLADTDVAALTTALLAAVAGGNYTNNTFQVLSALADAFIAFRKRRRQERAKSYEIPS